MKEVCSGTLLSNPYCLILMISLNVEQFFASSFTSVSLLISIKNIFILVLLKDYYTIKLLRVRDKLLRVNSFNKFFFM